MSQQISKTHKEERKISLPPWLADTSEPLCKKPTLDSNSIITDFFNKSKPFLPTYREADNAYSFPITSEKDKNRQQTLVRRALTDVSSQKYDSDLSERNSFSKYSSAVSHKSLSCGFKEPQLNRGFQTKYKSLTLSSWQNLIEICKPDDFVANNNNNSNNADPTCLLQNDSQDIFSILTPLSERNSQNEETGGKNATDSIETISRGSDSNVTSSLTNNQESTVLDGNVSCLSQELFSSSSESIFKTQASNPSQKIKEVTSLRTYPKRKRPAVSYVDFDDNVEGWIRLFMEGMKKVREAEVVAYEKYFGNIDFPLKPNKEALIAKISSVLAESERTGIIKYRTNGFSNCVFSENRLLMRPFNTAYYSFTLRSKRQTNGSFFLLRLFLTKIKSLLESGSSVTQRELYYQNINFMRNHRQISSNMNLISRILDVGLWELGVFNTSKGLVYGDLKIIFENGEIMNCNVAGGTLVPQTVDNIVRFDTKAEFILIVEKDTIFQKLLDEDFKKLMPIPFILITGKGYPDTNTRRFINQIYTVLKLPVFILVDADPSGIDIMLSYRIGTRSLAHLSYLLAIPNLHWLGVFPSEIHTLNLVKQKLTESDFVKIEQILQRDYMHHFPKIQEELRVMKRNEVKSEIEGVMKSDDFLSQFYLPRKFYNQDYL